MIRRLNYTGRKKIPRSRVTIRVATANDMQRFSADYDLTGLRFQQDARVFVEAYNSTSYMRFPFGTVGQREEPLDTRLTEITPRPLARFRLKVVDQTKRYGLLLGVADQLIPLRPDQDLKEKESLLPVDFVDLGDRVWRLDLSNGPVLELNKRVELIGEAARSGGSFVGLVFPEVVRRVLSYVVLELGETDPAADDDEWHCRWLRYATKLPGVDEIPGTKDEREQWIETTVEAFCRAHQSRHKLELALQREGL